MHLKTISDWQYEAHKLAREKGWWDEDRSIGDLLMLVTCEVAEAFEEYRKGHTPTEVYYSTDKRGNPKPEGIPVELADVVIRIMDFCERYGIDLHSQIRDKMEYNTYRSHRHGGKIV